MAVRIVEKINNEGDVMGRATSTKFTLELLGIVHAETLEGTKGYNDVLSKKAIGSCRRATRKFKKDKVLG